MTRYISVTDADRAARCSPTIGVGSIEELFADIPPACACDRAARAGPGLAEQEVYEELRALAAGATSAEDEVSFLGAGMYDHYVPALVDAIIQRSEFLTPYTPYQPEISQGGLQAMFEYQTAICELTGMEVSNASVYEGPSAVAAAGLRRQGRQRPHDRLRRSPAASTRTPASALRTLAHAWGMEVVEAAAREAAPPSCPELDDDVSAVIVQQPNFLGAVEDLTALARPRNDAGALTIAPCDPLAARRCSRRPASAASTSRSARARRSATASTSAARRSASSPPPRR